MKSFVLFILAIVSLATCQTPVGNSVEGASTELVMKFKEERNPYIQLDTAKRLAALGDPAVLPKLEPYLNDEDRLIRGNAALVFAALGDSRGFTIILDMLKNESPTRREAQEARYYAAHLLGDLKDKRAVPILLPLLNDPIVKRIAPWSLGEIGDKTAAPNLIALLDDKDPDMRVLAMYALEKLEAKQALPQVRALLSDSEHTHFGTLGKVSLAAREAVAVLGDPEWPAVEGKPAATRVNYSPDISSYSGECQVRYAVRGTEYDLWVVVHVFDGENALREKMASCPQKSFVVRYDPSNPGDSVAMHRSY